MPYLGRRRRLRWWIALALLAAVLLMVYLTTLAPGLTWANDGADGGDLVTAAATMGIAHPTGYPTYVLLARAAQALPLGTLATRTNLLSAAGAALAAILVAILVNQGYRGARRFARTGGLVAGLAFGLTPGLWSQAVITEVYTLHALLVGIILLHAHGLPLGAGPARPAASRQSWLNRIEFVNSGLLFGLALGNHLTSALLLPPWLAAAAVGHCEQRRARRFQVRPIVERLGGLALGALVYLYLPLRARAMPPVNWGGADTWEGFWWVVSGQPYRALAFGFPAAHVLTRLQAWAGLVLAQFGLLGMIVAFFGLFFGQTTSPRVRWVTGWMVVAFSAFAIGYGTADSYSYLLPAFLALAVWLGLGVATALDSLPVSLAGLEPILVCAFLLSLLINAGRRLPEVDASRDLRAEAFGRAVLAQAPSGALIFTGGDRDTFSLWYFHFALGERRDVAVVVEPMLVFGWYRESLRSTYASRDLIVPEPTSGRAPAADTWKAAVVAANARPSCETRPEAAAVLVCSP